MLPALPPDAPIALEPGSRLDRYELVCRLGQGGMGTVWLAHMDAGHGFDKLVALKTLLPQYAADPRFRSMFLDEARIASRIVHGNVVQILELGEQGGWLYQAMEWVEGDSLRRLMLSAVRAGEQLPRAIGMRIIADACAGVHAAHELRDRKTGELLDVVHRDISPQNILVCSNGITKIADFGIAKAKGRCAPETTSGGIKGKIRYMAPEQALGKAIDRRADIWALGSVLYEVLTGNRLFDAENEVELLRKLVSSAPNLEFDSNVSEAIATVVKRAVRPHASARFKTAAEMERALRVAAQQADLVAEPDDVARYFGLHLGEETRQRSLSIEQALEAVAQRSSGRERTPLPDATAPGNSLDPVLTETLPDPSTASIVTTRSLESDTLDTSPTSELSAAAAPHDAKQVPRARRSRNTGAIVLVLCIAIVAGVVATARLANRRGSVAIGERAPEVTIKLSATSGEDFDRVAPGADPAQPPLVLTATSSAGEPVASPLSSSQPPGSAAAATTRSRPGANRVPSTGPAAGAASIRTLYKKIDDGF